MTVDLLVFTIGRLRIALSLAAVQRIVRACELTPLPGAPGLVVGALNLSSSGRNRPMPHPWRCRHLLAAATAPALARPPTG